MCRECEKNFTLGLYYHIHKLQVSIIHITTAILRVMTQVTLKYIIKVHKYITNGTQANTIHGMQAKSKFKAVSQYSEYPVLEECQFYLCI